MVPAPIWWYNAARKFLAVVHWWPNDFKMPLDIEKLENIADKNELKVLKSLQSSGLVRTSAMLRVPKQLA